ncbi:MAG: TlpA family protein disulfide reductase [Nitrospirae bacterium]|nr:TlpA family protein disulfide reductase [Nitrospirota bacterium]
MKRICLFYIVVVTCFLFLDFPVFAEGKPPEEGSTLPLIRLPIPTSNEEKGYLDLKGEGTFTISQIKADVVIIEIFSMYCPYCQKEAPIVNELYNIIEQNPELRDKIKIIGIGAGNTSFEVDVFRKKYQISFPLFPDVDFSIHKICGEVNTPYFIGVKINRDQIAQVIYSKLGTIQDPAQFLNLILKNSGLKRED